MKITNKEPKYVQIQQGQLQIGTLTFVTVMDNIMIQINQIETVPNPNTSTLHKMFKIEFNLQWKNYFIE